MFHAQLIGLVQAENIQEQLSLLPRSPLATDAHAKHDVVFIEYRRVDHAGTLGSTARRCERRRIQDWAGHAHSLAESKALLLSEFDCVHSLEIFLQLQAKAVLAVERGDTIIAAPAGVHVPLVRQGNLQHYTDVSSRSGL
jgi:hypothetical protein